MKISVRNEEEVKTFSDEGKLREFAIITFTLKELLKFSKLNKNKNKINKSRNLGISGEIKNTRVKIWLNTVNCFSPLVFEVMFVELMINL